MIRLRKESELLELLKDIPSKFRTEAGDYQEPERCPYCRDLMTPSFNGQRIALRCTSCEENSPD